MDNQRFEGKNLDEALDNAASSLGIDRWQLSYAVLTEKRGFLGGLKNVSIEAWANDVSQPKASAPAASPQYLETSSDNDGPVLQTRTSAELKDSPKPRTRGGAETSGRRGRRRGRGNSAPAASGPGGGGRGGRSGHGQAPAVAAALELAPEQGPRSENAAMVAEWIERVIELGDFDLEIRTEETPEAITVRLFGADTGRLVDKGGELLDSIQVIANKSLVGRTVEKPIELDCAGFKDQRIETIQQKARELADRVRENGKEQLLPAMSPVERRIVHLALQDDVVVGTESRGEGFYKRVAIIRRVAVPELSPEA